ncbi:MAG: RNA polymerase sigma factor SigJ [Anaerolineales bacterium]|nr:RNA polymerase sigma factor SigJ [Anaerolineales bacterium]
MNIEQFQQYRPLLFSIAYRMLGSVAEAEDVLQDAYLRVQAHAAEIIEQPKYYLTTIVTRLCLNQLSAARTQREQYLGPWLPEPVLTADRPELVNPVEQAVIHDSLSIAFLVLLESLLPTERAVFLLHEVFDYKFGEIAEMLGKREAACRQLFRRAKAHIAEHRPRFAASPQQHERLLQSFIKVVELGEVDPFVLLLAEDVTLVPDGGGERGAAIRVLQGREVVSAFIFGTYRLAPKDLQYNLTLLNGQQAILARTAEGRPYFAVFIYSESEAVNLIHVIAGRKLLSLGP